MAKKHKGHYCKICGEYKSNESFGTAIAFMMTIVGLSLPEATLLKKVMTWRLIGIFFGTITVFIIFLGYLFNFIL